ncbi:hypothetical protein Bca101_017945 [Brassica carinata]
MRGPVFTVGRRGCDLSIKAQSMPNTLCEIKQSDVRTSNFPLLISDSLRTKALFLHIYCAARRSIGCNSGEIDRHNGLCKGRFGDGEGGCLNCKEDDKPFRKPIAARRRSGGERLRFEARMRRLNSEKSPFQRTYSSQVKLGELEAGLLKSMLIMTSCSVFTTNLWSTSSFLTKSVDPTNQVKFGFLTGLVPCYGV